MINNFQKKGIKKTLIYNISNTLLVKINNDKIKDFTITDIDITSDSSIIYVYLSFSTFEKQKLIIIQRYESIVKREILKVWSKRRAPQIIFRLDDSLERINRIEEIINHNSKK